MLVLTIFSTSWLGNYANYKSDASPKNYFLRLKNQIYPFSVQSPGLVSLVGDKRLICV